MSQHRAVRQRPPEGRLWAPDAESRPTARDQGVREKGDRTGGRAPEDRAPWNETLWNRSLGNKPLGNRSLGNKSPGDKSQRSTSLLDRSLWERSQRGGGPPNTGATDGAADMVIGGGPLTTAGVAVVLGAACLLGGLIDLLLVGTAAWAITGLFLAASVYAALKVHRRGWYSAVVGPPLAFALGLALVAAFSPHDLGSGPVGAAATMLELLAAKARTVFLGTAAALVIVLVRKLPFSR